MIDLFEKASYLNAMSVAYVKGKFVDASKAFISIDERGFRFGDGVFETILIKDREIKHLERHLERLANGLEILRIDKPIENIQTVSEQIVEKNNCNDAILRISITRGIGSKGYLPTINNKPTLIAQILPMPEPYKEPISLWLSQWRKPSIKSIPVQAKLAQGINSTLAIMEAKDNNCDEALILNNNEEICEASSANIFWSKNNEIYTPNANSGLVKGIARDILLENWQVRVENLNLNDLKDADSVMICNSIKGAIAVKTLKSQNYQWDDFSLASKAQEILNA